MKSEKIHKKEYNAKIAALVKDLESNDRIVRETARNKLVKIGKSSVEYLAALIDHPLDTYRWECVKTLGRIADPSSLPLLLKAMRDRSEEVWRLAVEGVIGIGIPAMVPLLKEFLCDPTSLWLRRGLHQYLTGLSPRVKKRKDVSDFSSALNVLEPEMQLSILAYRILEKEGPKGMSLTCGQENRYKNMVRAA